MGRSGSGDNETLDELSEEIKLGSRRTAEQAVKLLS